MNVLAFVRFESPGYLVLLALIPLLVALSYRSLAGLGPFRRVLAIIARCVVVLIMILALAGAQRTQKVDDLSVIFLVDRSKSIPQNLQREAFKYLERAGAKRPADDKIGVIGFCGLSEVNQLPMKTLEIEGVTTPAEPEQTNLAGAIRLALALLPSNTAGRIVIITDGNENVGDVLREAEQYSAAGIPIDVLPIEYEYTNEVVFEQLKTPPTATTEETINLQMVLRSQQRCTGKIELRHGNDKLDLNRRAPGTALAVELNPGPNRIAISVPLRAAGAHRFKATFTEDVEGTDKIKENNVADAFTVVSGQGRILILTTMYDYRAEQPSSLILERALEQERLVCDVKVAGEQPLDQVMLLDYSLVILSNVPAGDLREEERQALATYVRDLGGGLIMVGGDDSFGAGGWLGSPVEEVMPVSFDVKHKKEFFKGALVLVMHACEVPDGNHLGERCSIEAVKTLSSRDLVGVLAWQWLGDEQEHWAVPLQPVGNRTRIIKAIKKMSMGDLPDLDAVMRPGVEALIKRKDCGPKHMIVISDFDPQPPRNDLINKMKQHGITCTTIAIGYGGHFIDERKARWIADSTGGRFHRTSDYSKLPQIFIKESREVRRSLVQNIKFQPTWSSDALLSPVVTGMTTEGLPELGGFVLTTAKENAMIPIVRKAKEGEEDDPVLAHWQVGLGKTVAFTSGLWPKWGPSWVDWVKFSKFWAQTVRWASRQSEAAAFDVTTSVQGGKAKVRIDAVDKNADVINFMKVAGRVLHPGSDKSEPLRLTQTGPGRYEAEFDTHERGNYILDLRCRDADGKDTALQTGLSVAYSPEYSQMRANLPLLEELRSRTDGRLLSHSAPDAVFDRAGLPPAETRHVMWETLVRWLLLLFLVDIAIRRIALNPIEMARKVRRFVGEMAGRGRPPSEAVAVLSTLKDTRDRVRDEQAAATERDAARPAAAARYEARTPDVKATE
ncbi:MAG: hypothetical protein KAY37_16600, partial [Phycisphaerae bacterium]|nr:hypothetical protein [Phycisphaerae bacterium]